MLTEDHKTIEAESETFLEKVKSRLFEPSAVVVAVVRSSSAVEADVDDADLMNYYLDHPETDRQELLASSDH